jgi:hypothetical protein
MKGRRESSPSEKLAKKSNLNFPSMKSVLSSGDSTKPIMGVSL